MLCHIGTPTGQGRTVRQCPTCNAVIGIACCLCQHCKTDLKALRKRRDTDKRMEEEEKATKKRKISTTEAFNRINAAVGGYNLLNILENVHNCTWQYTIQTMSNGCTCCANSCNEHTNSAYLVIAFQKAIC